MMPSSQNAQGILPVPEQAGQIWPIEVKGREGQYRVRLMHNTKGADCTYPGMELLPDGTFVTMTYGHWTAGEEPYIVSVRFKLSELDAKAKRGEVLAAGR